MKSIVNYSDYYPTRRLVRPMVRINCFTSLFQEFTVCVLIFYRHDGNLHRHDSVASKSETRKIRVYVWLLDHHST